MQLFATSRPLDDIQEFSHSNGYSQLDMRAKENDIKLYLRAQIGALRATGASLYKFLHADNEFRSRAKLSMEYASAQMECMTSTPAVSSLLVYLRSIAHGGS